MRTISDVIPRNANQRREVYFVQAAKEGLIKIGVANDARRRLSSIRTDSPVPLDPLGGGGGGGDGGDGRFPPDRSMTDKALEYKLVDLMKDDGIEAEERSAIWTLIQYLTAKAKAAPK